MLNSGINRIAHHPNTSQIKSHSIDSMHKVDAIVVFSLVVFRLRVNLGDKCELKKIMITTMQ